MLAATVCHLRPSVSATGHPADRGTMDVDCYALAQFLAATLLLLVTPGPVTTPPVTSGLNADCQVREGGKRGRLSLNCGHHRL